MDGWMGCTVFFIFLHLLLYQYYHEYHWLAFMQVVFRAFLHSIFTFVVLLKSLAGGKEWNGVQASCVHCLSIRRSIA
ncbi:hypothetical protein B0H65DRAFT_469387 [Neurospora tetraspora]|uniref:Uncharacterized protein n=1 Tax=Neurospora tetraspora TaxID=94610 RepID=A0AAE0JCV6_9PEZI|nr:hypothetical protein B0H65DRAFT_469387 [Neurospora tetraspora]